MEKQELTDREKSILRYVVHQFILTANPVGSRNISKKYDIGLSPASIRNIMSDLEESGFLGHPHTSAGRVPTDKGYRFYVDSLMKPEKLKPNEIQFIKESLDPEFIETEELLKLTSIILSKITQQIACVTYPKFEQAILSKIQLISVASNRLLVVVSIEAGLVKTITLEINVEVDLRKLDEIQSILNERLAGLRFDEIKRTFHERIKDKVKEDFKPIVRLFLDSANKIFSDFKIDEKSIITGAKNILKHPEFDDHDNFETIIELIENKEVVVHVMDKRKNNNQKNVTISIGDELNDNKFSNYSLISKDYEIGGASGTLGIIGPKRMHYSKMIAAVVYIAESISKEFKNK